MDKLYALFKQGLTSQKRTLSRGRITIGPGGRPVIVTITDTQGTPIGDFWISDIQSLIESSGTTSTNPNVAVMRVILNDMLLAEKGLLDMSKESNTA